MKFLIILFLSLFLISSQSDYYGKSGGFLRLHVLDYDTNITGPYGDLYLSSQHGKLSEPITVGSYIFNQLRVLEIDVVPIKAISREIAFRFFDDKGGTLLSYPNRNYPNVKENVNDFTSKTFIFPVCKYYCCEVGFFFSDPQVRGNNIYSSTKPLDYAFYITYKNKATGNFIAYTMGYRDYWFPFTYIPYIHWISKKFFATNSIPSYVMDTGYEPTKRPEDRSNILFGPIWPLTDSNTLFTASVLQQKYTGNLNYDYNLVKDDTLLRTYGAEIDENVKDIFICINNNDKNMNGLDESKYYRYYYRPGGANGGRATMKKYDNTDDFHSNGAIMYYINNNATFNIYGQLVNQQHMYPACVRRVKQNIPTILKFSPGVTLKSQIKKINGESIIVLQVPKSVVNNGLSFQCTFDISVTNNRFKNYHNNVYSTWLTKMEKVTDNFNQYKTKHITTKLPFPNQHKDLGVYSCGSEDSSNVLTLPPGGKLDGKYLLIPENGDVYSVSETYFNRESASVLCEKKIDSIGTLKSMSVIEPNIENRKEAFCKKDSSKDFIYSGPNVSYNVKIQDNTQVICTYTTPIGTTFKVEKSIKLQY